MNNAPNDWQWLADAMPPTPPPIPAKSPVLTIPTLDKLKHDFKRLKPDHPLYPLYEKLIETKEAEKEMVASSRFLNSGNCSDAEYIGKLLGLVLAITFWTTLFFTLAYK
jgi:hypothetical protein